MLLIYIIAIILTLASLIFPIRWIREWRRVRKLINEIPGPTGMPLFGNMEHILCSPEKLWQNLRTLSKEFRPIYKLWACHVPAVFLFSPEDVEILIASSKNMEKSLMYQCLHGWLGTGLLTSTGTKWQFRRKLLTPAFHFSILKQFLLVFSEQSDLLVEQLQIESNKPYINILPFVSKFTLNSICETAMGINPRLLDSNEERYRNAIYKIGDYVIFRILRPWLYYNITFFCTKTFWRQRKLTTLLQKFSLSVIGKRKNSSEDLSNTTVEEDVTYSKKKRLAMLDLLISAKNSGQSIDDEGIREEVDTFMFEGHDTTTMAISFTLMLLACNQEIQEKVRTEVNAIIKDRSQSFYSYEKLQQLKYLEMVIKESLRLYPSVPLIARLTSEDITTHSGYILPSNINVNVLIYDMQRDPLYFPNPEKFDPDRFLPEGSQSNKHPFVYIPFSAGPRNCIGQKFAMLELKMVTAKIIQYFKLLPVDTPDTIRLTTDLLLRPVDGVKIKLEPINI